MTGVGPHVPAAAVRVLPTFAVPVTVGCRAGDGAGQHDRAGGVHLQRRAVEVGAHPQRDALAHHGARQGQRGQAAPHGVLRHAPHDPGVARRPVAGRRDGAVRGVERRARDARSGDRQRARQRRRRRPDLDAVGVVLGAAVAAQRPGDPGEDVRPQQVARHGERATGRARDRDEAGAGAVRLHPLVGESHAGGGPRARVDREGAADGGGAADEGLTGREALAGDGEDDREVASSCLGRHGERGGRGLRRRPVPATVLVPGRGCPVVVPRVRDAELVRRADLGAHGDGAVGGGELGAVLLAQPVALGGTVLEQVPVDVLQGVARGVGDLDDDAGPRVEDEVRRR